MWMREKQRVDGSYTLTAQKWNDDSFADLFGGRSGAAPLFQAAARVDHQRIAERRADDDRIGLSNVEHDDAQAMIDSARRPRNQHRAEKEERQRRRPSFSFPKHNGCD